MNAQDMYRGVLLELDKYGAPEFEVEDFNWFINSAVSHWLKNELDQFEVTQKVNDNVSCLVKKESIPFNVDNSTDVRQADLPSDYRHVVSCLVKLRYKAATVVYSIGNTRGGYTKRITGDGEAAIMENSYLRPLVSDGDIDMYHRTLGNKISILFDAPGYENTSVTIESVMLEYISEPDAITLDEDKSVITDTPFPDQANHELVLICARLFLENSGSQRTQSHSAINN